MGEERFCRGCGAPFELGEEAPGSEAATDVYPARPDTLVAPVVQTAFPPPVPGVAAGRERPKWLLPALIAGAAALVVVVGAAVWASSGSSQPAPLAQQAAPLVAPVSDDLAEVDSGLAGARNNADLASLKIPASRLARDAHRAADEVRALKVRGAEREGAQELASALDDAADFGAKTASAAGDPRAATTGPAKDAAEAARQSFAVAAATLPSMSLPRASQFSVDAIDAVSQQQAQKAEQAHASAARARAYVSQIDRLLQNSADTRGNLGDLIAGVQNGSISAAEAKSQIASIVNQRQDLQNAVAAIDAPPPFAHSALLLRRSLSAAIDDDLAIQGWIDAWLTGDSYTFDSWWQKHLDATAAASSAKASFVATYDAARRRVLKLGPLSVGDSY